MVALIPDCEEFAQRIVNEAIQCPERLEQGGTISRVEACPLSPLYPRRPSGFNLCSVDTCTGTRTLINRDFQMVYGAPRFRRFHETGLEERSS